MCQLCVYNTLVQATSEFILKVIFEDFIKISRQKMGGYKNRPFSVKGQQGNLIVTFAPPVSSEFPKMSLPLCFCIIESATYKPIPK